MPTRHEPLVPSVLRDSTHAAHHSASSLRPQETRLPTCVLAANSSLACRTATQQGYLLVAAALRCFREFVSQFAALPRGPWLQPARARPQSCVSSNVAYAVPRVRSGPSSRFLDGRGARSFNADERLLLQEKRKNANPGKRICSLIEGSSKGKCRPGCIETSHLRCTSDRWTYEVACEG
jgi:hypothetical protein